MPFTRGAREVPNQTPASTSDARKRKAEKSEARASGGQLGTFVDPYDRADRGETTVVPPGTVTVPRDALRWALDTLGQADLLPAHAGGLLHSDDLRDAIAPPPAEPVPWEAISTDREQPTTAWVTFENAEDEPVLGRWFRDKTGRISCRGRGGWGEVQYVIAVNLVTVLDPETHVPVERALIDEAAEYAEAWDSGRGEKARGAAYSLVRDLAALADGAES